MQNNLIKIQDGTIYRILQERDSEWLVIDCIKRTMPKWIESLAEFESVPESVLWVTTGIYPTDTNTLSAKEKKYMNEHYSLFASVLGVIDDEKTRSYIIREIAELYKVTKQTIRNNLCCGGVVSILITLLHDSQEMAIMSGYDTLDLTILEETYKSRLSMLHGYIKPNMGAKANQKRKKRVPEISNEILCIENESLISDLSTIVKQGAMDIDEMINRMNVAFMVEVIAC